MDFYFLEMPTFGPDAITNSMNTDYFDLKSLQSSPGWVKLQALWAKQYALVIEDLMKTARKGNETSWRFKAGQMQGFDLAIQQLDRALLQMEKEGEDANAGPNAVDELMKEIRGDKK